MTKRITDSWLGNYIPRQPYIGHSFLRLPPMTGYHIEMMMRTHRILFALALIKGPILSRTRITIQDGSTPENPSPMRRFLRKQLGRMWRSLPNVLSAVEWGWSGAECLYRVRENQVHFHKFVPVTARDARPVTKHGQLMGVQVLNSEDGGAPIYLGGFKGFWLSHKPEVHRWFGSSKLVGSYPPWMELFGDGGGNDSRQLFYYKYAMNPETVRHPEGASREPDGTRINNIVKARQLSEQRRSGASIAMPNTRDEQGNYEWDIEPSTVNPGGLQLLDYCDKLKDEIVEGAEVPLEIFEAASSGSGYSGRSIPLEAFFGSLQPFVNHTVESLEEQVARPLCLLNGYTDDFELEVGSLIDTITDQPAERPGDPQGIKQDAKVGMDSQQQPQLTKEAA